jgi:hypothetical protein
VARRDKGFRRRSKGSLIMLDEQGARSVDAFEKLEQVGEGTYGQVRIPRCARLHFTTTPGHKGVHGAKPG